MESTALFILISSLNGGIFGSDSTILAAHVCVWELVTGSYRLLYSVRLFLRLSLEAYYLLREESRSTLEGVMKIPLEVF